MKKNLGNLISWSSVVIVIMSLYSLNVQIITIAILIAAVMDMFDGKYARLYGENTEEALIFGEITDSLCDIFNFGVAPSLLLIAVKFSNDYHLLLLIVSALFIWAGIFRLARFSARKDRKTNEPVDYYTGIPITVAGPLAAVALNFSDEKTFVILVMLFFSWSMISNLQIKKLKI